MRHKARGFTLTELLIALGIGTSVLAGMIQMLASSNQLLRNQQELSLMQENGRYTISIMSRLLRQAGFDITTQANAIRGCNDTPTCVTDATVPNITVTGVIGDTLQVMSDSRRDSITDCQGNLPAPIIDLSDVVNIFYVKNDPDNEDIPSLFCFSSNANKEVAMIDHVQNMQVLYGVDTDNDQSANQYLNAASIAADASISMEDVVTLRIGLLVIAANNTKSRDDTKSYEVAGTTIAGDSEADFIRRLKRVFNVTVDLRNRDK